MIRKAGMCSPFHTAQLTEGFPSATKHLSYVPSLKLCNRLAKGATAEGIEAREKASSFRATGNEGLAGIHLGPTYTVSSLESGTLL